MKFENLLSVSRSEAGGLKARKSYNLPVEYGLRRQFGAATALWIRASWTGRATALQRAADNS